MYGNGVQIGTAVIITETVQAVIPQVLQQAPAAFSAGVAGATTPLAVVLPIGAAATRPTAAAIAVSALFVSRSSGKEIFSSLS